MPDERTPLLSPGLDSDDPHTQFCMLVGVPSSDPSSGTKHRSSPSSKTLYGRAIRLRAHQNVTHMLTTSFSNTLLLTQVVLGAALTGLGASESSHILITVFGALNTIIAGLVAYLKSRGQPMRTRMYRDDLERVVDEIEYSEVMWLGISKGVHGYDEIDTDTAVTVRSEVARLTRLYDRAVRNNTFNNPDMYLAGQSFDGANAGLKNRPPPAPAAVVAAVAPPVPVAASTDAPAPVPAAASAPAVADPDESPATAPKLQPTKSRDAPTEASKDDSKATTEVAIEDHAAKDDAESDLTKPAKEDPKPAPAEDKLAPSSKDATPPEDGFATSSDQSKPSGTSAANGPVSVPAHAPALVPAASTTQATATAEGEEVGTPDQLSKDRTPDLIKKKAEAGSSSETATAVTDETSKPGTTDKPKDSPNDGGNASEAKP